MNLAILGSPKWGGINRATTGQGGGMFARRMPGALPLYKVSYL